MSYDKLLVKVLFTQTYTLSTFPLGPLSVIPSVPKQVVAGTIELLSRGVVQSVGHLAGVDTWRKCGEEFSSSENI
jgi:hypothetical protein